MTVVMGETDVDWFTLIDFEADVPCTIVKADCENIAEWKFVHSCCGVSILSCDFHKKYVEQWVETMPNVGCMNCNYKWLNPKLSDVFSSIVKI